MRIRRLREFWIYTVCTLIAVIILFILNWLMQLPAFIPIIGNENTWLPIVANAVISGMIFIVGNKFNNSDRLRQKISNQKHDLEIINAAVSRVVNSLNIDRKHRYFLYALNVDMDVASLIKEVMETQQEIDDAQQELNQSRYLIQSKEELNQFDKNVRIVTDAYHIVFDGLQKTLNDWQTATSQVSHTKTVTELVGGATHKQEFAIEYAASCKKLEKAKKNFLDVLESQKSDIDEMKTAILDSSKQLLDAEYRIITNLEAKL